ncbi:MAG TPA: alpha/beta hydrolase [Xanthobacteraceae bacterium]|nr:alpha/beta hydrolase [Xanthobacteraceae bacterium]
MDLVSTPSNPVPEGAVVGEITAPNGTAIRYARWLPPPGRKGTVCLFQGRAEFIEKYFEVVTELRRRGFAVATLDWRGQGLSQRRLAERRKGHVGSFKEFDADLETFMRDVVLPDCPPPYYALAHSMGGAIVLRAAGRGRRWFERIVLSAPMIALHGRPMAPAVRMLIRAMRFAGLGRSYVPGGGATSVTSLPFEGNELTSDPVRYARTGKIVEAEPALALGSPTIAWLDSAYTAMAEFADPSYPRRLDQPILMIAAGQDTVVSTPAIEQFAIRMRAGAHVVVAGARHELMMEQDFYRGQFWAAFDAFVPGSAAP